MEDQIAERDNVATRWRATGTQTGAFAGVAGTGRRIAVTGLHIHRIASGRLLEHWEELNLLGALRQMRAPG